MGIFQKTIVRSSLSGGFLIAAIFLMPIATGGCAFEGSNGEHCYKGVTPTAHHLEQGVYLCRVADWRDVVRDPGLSFAMENYTEYAVFKIISKDGSVYRGCDEIKVNNLHRVSVQRNISHWVIRKNGMPPCDITIDSMGRIAKMEWKVTPLEIETGSKGTLGQ